MVQLGRVEPYYNEFVDLFPHRNIIHPHWSMPIDLDDYIALVEACNSNRIKRSIIWNFCRALPPSSLTEVDEIRRSGFFKEFRASQNIVADHQLMSYGLLLNEEVPFLVSSEIRMASRAVAYTFYIRLKQIGILFPKVQRTKNVSMETGQLASEYCKVIPSKVTTRDLEVIYHRHGIKIGGSCELRSAWKFNDLKPRLYYCQGGRDYFNSRYMKRIAVDLMESIPTTSQRLRTHPERYLEHDVDQDYIVMWDFESFTTRLSELKYFLDAVCIALREFPEIELNLFDYRDGLVTVNPVELLEQYNEAVNIQSPFSIHRIISRFGYELDPSPDYYQQNSGMLGVAGNIGFSTAWHGYSILETVGPDKGVSVGDDGLCILPDPADIIEPLQEVAKIHPEKFASIPPHDYDPFRFLKRAFYREPNGTIMRDTLFNLPLIAFIEQVIIARDVFPDSDDFFLKRVIKASGAFLWEIQVADPPLTDEEFSIAEKYLKRAYHAFGLPNKGCLPGYQFNKGPFTDRICHMAVPSLEFNRFDPRLGDWLEYLLYNARQSSFSVPLLGYSSTCERPSKGSTVYSGKGKTWAALEDMGYVRKRAITEVKDYIEEIDRDAFRRRLKRLYKYSDLVPMYEIEIIDEIPDVFDFLFTVPSSSLPWDVLWENT